MVIEAEIQSRNLAPAGPPRTVLATNTKSSTSPHFSSLPATISTHEGHHGTIFFPIFSCEIRSDSYELTFRMGQRQRYSTIESYVKSLRDFCRWLRDNNLSDDKRWPLGAN